MRRCQCFVDACVDGVNINGYVHANGDTECSDVGGDVNIGGYVDGNRDAGINVNVDFFV